MLTRPPECPWGEAPDPHGSPGPGLSAQRRGHAPVRVEPAVSRGKRNSVCPLAVSLDANALQGESYVNVPGFIFVSVVTQKKLVLGVRITFFYIGYFLFLYV